MTIRPGQAWGSPIIVPPGVRVASTDRQVAELAATAGLPIRPTAGDLAATLGIGAGRAVPAVGSTSVSCPVDVGWAVTPAGSRRFVAHCVARRSWWSGEVVLVMNAQFLAAWDVAPRSHPNDGRLDVVTVASTMSSAQRWRASRRAPRGEHLPHPSITTARITGRHFTFERPRTIWLDGERWCRSAELTVEIEPDAIEVII